MTRKWISTFCRTADGFYVYFTFYFLIYLKMFFKLLLWKHFTISVHFTKSRKCTRERFLKATRNRMSRLPKADEANIFPGFLNTVCSGSFRKPVHVAFIRFWKPLWLWQWWLSKSFLDSRIWAFIQIRNHFHRSAKEMFKYFQGKSDKIKI